MSKTLQFRRYDSTTLSTITGASGEIIMDLSANTLTAHDGVTRGGYRLSLSKEANVINVFAQSAYNQANAANVLAQSSFNQGNTANLIANTAAANITILFGIQTTQNTWIASNAVFTQSSYTQANIANVLAQASFDKANSANVLAQSALNKASFGYSSNSVITSNSTGYLSNSTGLSYTSSNNTLIAANITVPTLYTTTGGIVFPDGTTQTTTASGSAIDSFARTIANAAFVQGNTANLIANTASANITILYGIQTTQNTWISSNATFTQSAYTQANTANLIANTAAANISILYGIQTTQNTWISANAAYLSSAYSFANTINTYAFSAYTQANSASVAAANEPIGKAAFNAANSAANISPQNLQTVSYTLANTDAGAHIYYMNTANVNLYIPWTANTNYLTGTKIQIVSHSTNNSNVTVIPNTGVSLFSAGNTISGNHNVTTYGVASLLMVAANTWYISGFGVV